MKTCYQNILLKVKLTFCQVDKTSSCLSAVLSLVTAVMNTLEAKWIAFPRQKTSQRKTDLSESPIAYK